MNQSSSGAPATPNMAACQGETSPPSRRRDSSMALNGSPPSPAKDRPGRGMMPSR